MELDDLKGAWTTAGQTAGDVSLDELIPRLQRLRRRLFWRDAREIVAAAVVFPFFAWAGWGLERHGGPVLARIAIGLILAGLLLVVGVLLWARRPRACVESSMDEHLRAELSHLDRQIFILHHVTWWYVAPLTIGVDLFAVASRGAWPVFGVIVYVIITLALSAFLVRLNRRGADRLRSVRDSLVRGLEAVDGSHTNH